VHNERVPSSSRLRLPAAVLVLGLALAGCSSGGRQSATTPSPSLSPSPSPSSTVDVPQGVSLTAVGADLSFGDSATVIYEPNQKSGTVLRLTVQQATKGTVKDFKGFILDDYTKESTPYYVDVKVENVGEGEVGRTPVPLWGVDADNTLLPAATFTTSFPRCESDKLPKRFESGDSFKTCLVYLAPDHGELKAVSFRPNQEFDPIQWTGDIAVEKAKAGKKG
jgi:hypothetical protein